MSAGVVAGPRTRPATSSHHARRPLGPRRWTEESCIGHWLVILGGQQQRQAYSGSARCSSASRAAVRRSSGVGVEQGVQMVTGDHRTLLHAASIMPQPDAHPSLTASPAGAAQAQPAVAVARQLALADMPPFKPLGTRRSSSSVHQAVALVLGQSSAPRHGSADRLWTARISGPATGSGGPDAWRSAASRTLHWPQPNSGHSLRSGSAARSSSAASAGRAAGRDVDVLVAVLARR